MAKTKRRIRALAGAKEVDPTLLKKMVEDQTPLPGNKCKKKGCKGKVVRRVTGRTRGRFYYGLPKCNRCGRAYLNAKGVPCVGAEEFLKRLKIPITI